MHTIKKILFIGLFLTFILSSCSIEKRVYMSGYHIEWKNGKETESSNDKDTEADFCLDTNNQTDNTFATAINLEDNVVVASNVGEKKIILPQKEKKYQLSSHPYHFKNLPMDSGIYNKNKISDDPEFGNEKFDFFGLGSFILTVLLADLLALFMWVDVPVVLMIVVLSVLFIGTITLGIISIRREIKSSEKYKGYGWAIASIAFLSLMLLLALTGA